MVAGMPPISGSTAQVGRIADVPRRHGGERQRTVRERPV
jgi:hypothetical protein